MIKIREVDSSYLELYDKIPMIVRVCTEYKARRIENGLGGIWLEEHPVKPYIKDFSIYERAAEYEKNFDIRSWRFYMAFDGKIPVAAMTIAGRTKHLNMLNGRSDACVLWDIRVEEKFKRQGIGKQLLHMGIINAKKDGYKQLIIECQNNNVPACRFYEQQGAKLSKIDMYAYYLDAGVENEIQLLWYLDLQQDTLD